MYVTLMQSDTVQSHGRAKAETSPVGVGLRKKPKDLSAHEISHEDWRGCVAQKNKGPECT